jgi:hypothetical protein
MQKTILLFVLLCCSAAAWGASALPAFDDDLMEVERDFAALTELEQALDNQCFTYVEMQTAQHPLTGTIRPDQDLVQSLVGIHEPDRLMDIPSFWWGFCGSLAGILFVNANIEQEEIRQRELRRAWLGCFASGTATFLTLNLLAWLEVLYF